MSERKSTRANQTHSVTEIAKPQQNMEKIPAQQEEKLISSTPQQNTSYSQILDVFQQPIQVIFC